MMTVIAIACKMTHVARCMLNSNATYRHTSRLTPAGFADAREFTLAHLLLLNGEGQMPASLSLGCKFLIMIPH